MENSQLLGALIKAGIVKVIPVTYEQEGGEKIEREGAGE